MARTTGLRISNSHIRPSFVVNEDAAEAASTIAQEETFMVPDLHLVVTNLPAAAAMSPAGDAVSPSTCLCCTSFVWNLHESMGLHEGTERVVRVAFD